ncbi:MAG: hypothetical protein ACRDFB_06425 [Rhabdochlamydiaceae bacterium]
MAEEVDVPIEDEPLQYNEGNYTEYPSLKTDPVNFRYTDNELKSYYKDKAKEWDIRHKLYESRVEIVEELSEIAQRLYQAACVVVISFALVALFFRLQMYKSKVRSYEYEDLAKNSEQ